VHEHPPIDWHTHRRVAAPIRDVAQALDLFAWQASVRPASPYASLFTRTGERPGRAPSERCFIGRVRTRAPIATVPVELDLAPWSRFSSALGLRPAGRRPSAVNRGRYFATAHSLLDDLALKLDVLIQARGGVRSDGVQHIARVLTASRDTPDVAGLVTAAC
jgi:hypothetical protein